MNNGDLGFNCTVGWSQICNISHFTESDFLFLVFFFKFWLMRWMNYPCIIRGAKWTWWFYHCWLPSGYVKIAIENGHRNSGFSHEKWWFSIAMLVYQRVMFCWMFLSLLFVLYSHRAPFQVWASHVLPLGTGSSGSIWNRIRHGWCSWLIGYGRGVITCLSNNWWVIMGYTTIWLWYWLW